VGALPLKKKKINSTTNLETGEPKRVTICFDGGESKTEEESANNSSIPEGQEQNLNLTSLCQPGEEKAPFQSFLRGEGLGLKINALQRQEESEEVRRT